MRTILCLLLNLSLLLLLSCESDGTDTSANSTTDPNLDTTEISSDEAATSLFSRQLEKECNTEGKTLDGNVFWAKRSELLIVIKADSSTLDPTLGESHRILEVYDKECKQITRKTLPVNRSPDFPYYLAEIIYNNTSQVLPIRGFDVIFLYDLTNKKLLPSLEPQFTSERFGKDAQSGRIEHLEVWENYLIGYSRDYGSFVFRINDDKEILSISPIAEYKFEDEYYPLFALESRNEIHQLILPTYNRRTDAFSVNPMLSQPTRIEVDNHQESTDSRYVALSYQSVGKSPVLIDIKNQKQISLPPEKEAASLKEIIEWVQASGQ